METNNKTTQNIVMMVILVGLWFVVVLYILPIAVGMKTNNGYLDGVYNTRSDNVSSSTDKSSSDNNTHTGSYYTAGIYFEKNPNAVQYLISSVASDSPAEKAGVKAGDAIQLVDGKAVSDLSYTEVLGLLEGEYNSTLNMQLAHPATSTNTAAINYDVSLKRTY